MKQPFEAVIRILKTCKDGANDQILRYKYPLTYLTDGKNQFIKSGMAEKSRLSVAVYLGLVSSHVQCVWETLMIL